MYTYILIVDILRVFVFIQSISSALLSNLDDTYYSSERLDGLSHSKCEQITIPFCQGIEYNQTMMPNLYGHHSQQDVSVLVATYVPALKVRCSPDTQAFLCSYYAPVCTDPGPLPPCRSFCLSVKNDCEKMLMKFNVPWPTHLECNNFPDDSLDKTPLCVKKNRSLSSDMPNIEETLSKDFIDTSQLTNKNFKANNWLYVNTISKNFSFTCPEFLKIDRGYDDLFRINNTVVSNCALPCNNMFFGSHERRFAHIWIGSWSLICAISCLFTVLTYALNTSRFRYPERPIIILAFCYLIISTIYILGSISNNQIACRKPLPDKPLLTIIQGTKNEFCTIMFIGLYFFGMASSLWWVILALTWFLAAGLKWGHEAIEANSQYFHLVAWALPTIKTIFILALGKVEGDDLTGVCNVGIWNMDTMRVFVLIPLSLYLFIGIAFLIFGFVSLFRIRKVMKHDGTRTDKLEKLMLRIGIFSFLYTVPALTVIICLIYEQINFNSWMVTWYSDVCHSGDALIKCSPKGQDSKPMFLLFMLKYLSSLIVGITSSVWVWSSKTLLTWKRVLLKATGKQGQTFV